MVTVNKIGPKVNFLLGIESTTRVDPRAYPRTEKHEDDSDLATDALNFATDEADYEFKRSYATKHQVVEGTGGTMLGVLDLLVHEKRRIVFTLDPIEWDRIWYDPRSRQPDYADARYTGIVVWRDFEEVRDDPIYKGKEDILQQTQGAFADANMGFWGDSMDDAPRRWYDEKSGRIQILECYWREWVKGKLVWWGGHFTRAGWIIDPFVIPFRDHFDLTWNPMELVSGFVDREGFRYGVVRWMRSPQDEINKRRSKLMHHLSTNQVLYEEQAIDDIEEFMEEVAKPDGKLRTNRNALAEGRVVVRGTGEMAQGQMEVYNAATAELEAVGPGGAGDAPASSAREFTARQEAGTMQMQPIFQNLRRFDLNVFKKLWWLIRQNWKEDMWLRVRDEEDNKGYRFVRINKPTTKGRRVIDLIVRGSDPQEAITDVFGPSAGPAAARVYGQLVEQFTQVAQAAQQAGEDPIDPNRLALQSLLKSKPAKEPFTENDIAQVDVDIRIEVTDASPTVQAAQHELLLNFLHRMQTAGMNVPEKWIEMVIMSSPLHEKRKLIAKLNEPPPPEVQAQQAKQQEALNREMEGRIAKLEAEAQLKTAQAKKADTQAEAVVAEVSKAQAATAKLIVETEAIEEGALKPSRGVGNDSALQ